MFSVTLKTAGAQTVTLSDTVASDADRHLDGGHGLPRERLLIDAGGLGDATAGTPQPVVVTVHDQYGNLAKGYTGTVAFSSSDPQPHRFRRTTRSSPPTPARTRSASR